MADERSANHVKPDGSVGAYNEQQILWTSSEGMGQNMHNILLRGKPFEDLGSIVTSVAGLNRPLVLISQDNGESDGATSSQNEAESLRGVASSMDIPMTQNVVLSQGENRIADTVTSAVPSIRTIHVPLSEGVNRTASIGLTAAVPTNPIPSTSADPTQDNALSVYQQQIMLNAQLFVQQQHTVNALINKVDGLAKLVETNAKKGNPDQSTTVSQLRPNRSRANAHTTAHNMSDSDLQEVSSDSDNEDSEYEEGNSDTDTVASKDRKQGVSDNMQLLQELGKEFNKVEELGPCVDDTLSKVVDSGIRYMIDRNLAKELCSKYKRPENCKSLVVPKINKELWNTTSLAKTNKEQDRVYQTAQKYLNQGLIPLVQLIDNLLKNQNSENNFRLARDSLQLVAYAHRDLSNLRRQKLKVAVADKYKPLCNDSTPLTDNLLGDELEKQIKTLDDMRKVGKDLTKHRVEKRKHRGQDSTYDRPNKFVKPNSYGYSSYKSKDKNSFLERKSRYQHKPGHQGHQKFKKNHKQ